MPTLREKTVNFLRRTFGNWFERQPDSGSSQAGTAEPAYQPPLSQPDRVPATDLTQLLKQHKQKSAKQTVERFVQRFQPVYRELVYYTALPLVLTPELVNYLRNQFLREEEVPWVAEVDLLLSDLCKQVGYELYAMDTAVRAYALAEMKRELGIEQMQQVAQLLLEYVTQLWHSKPSLSHHELQAQQWAAMVYLDEKRESAVQEMARSLSDNVASAASRMPDTGSLAFRAELSHLSHLVDTLSPELERYPDLVEYARDVANILKNPAGIPRSRLHQKRTAAGVELPKLSQIVPQPPTIEVTEQPREWQDPLTGMEFVWIPPGRFMMGQTETDKEYLMEVLGEKKFKEYNYDIKELPRHDVHIAQGFWMGKYPVTQAQWLTVIGENPSYFKEKEIGETWRDHPVEQVSWDDVQEFLKKWNEKTHPSSSQEGKHESTSDARNPLLGGVRGGLLFRLPSEAEWEYACRAGAETMFCFGDEVELLKEYAWYETNSDNKTHPVGQLKPNDWGLYDMHGNVWEWCADTWHDSYEGAPDDGGEWQSLGEEKTKLLRGGSWFNNPRNCRCAHRSRRILDDRGHDSGFRVVRGGVGRTL